MNGSKRRAANALIALGAWTVLVTLSSNARAASSNVDPEAVQTLKRTLEFLDGLQQFSVRTQSTIEELRFSGHRVDYNLAANVTVRRPDRLRAERIGEVMNQRFFYDGRSLTLYNPDEKVYATQAAPETVEGMIEFARETVGILLPAADLLYRDAFPLMMRDVTLATVVGKTIVDGVTCDHLLFSRPEVDFQILVAEGSRPFPVKYIVTETGTPERLSIATVLSDWNLAPAVEDAQFRFVPPAGASATRFIPYGTTRATDR